MEWQTAQRFNYSTTLKWLLVQGQKLVGVVDKNGNELRDISVQELCKHYVSRDGKPAPSSLFSGLESSSKAGVQVKDEMLNKTEDRTPKQIKNSRKAKKEEVKEKPAMTETTHEANPVSQQEVFDTSVETVHELVGRKNGEVVYVMEFPEWDDLMYRYGKMKEKYPFFTFGFRTKRSIVSYGSLT